LLDIEQLSAYAAELTTHGQPAGAKNRRALVIAGDDLDAKATVTRLLDQFGFDTVDAGPLKEGWRIQRDTPGYGPRRTGRNCAETSQRPNGTRICKSRIPNGRAVVLNGREQHDHHGKMRRFL
jgi:hypothetical protein